MGDGSAQDWRGLGGVLFDSLAAGAARAGVAALEADVLADNRAMLGLAAARGYAVVHTAERRVVRIVVGTATTVPPWPAGTPSPRLLVETPAAHWRLAPAAEEAG